MIKSSLCPLMRLGFITTVMAPLLIGSSFAQGSSASSGLTVGEQLSYLEQSQDQSFEARANQVDAFTYVQATSSGQANAGSASKAAPQVQAAPQDQSQEGQAADQPSGSATKLVPGEVVAAQPVPSQPASAQTAPGDEAAVAGSAQQASAPQSALSSLEADLKMIAQMAQMLNKRLIALEKQQVAIAKQQQKALVTLNKRQGQIETNQRSIAQSQQALGQQTQGEISRQVKALNAHIQKQLVQVQSQTVELIELAATANAPAASAPNSTAGSAQASQAQGSQTQGSQIQGSQTQGSQAQNSAQNGGQNVPQAGQGQQADQTQDLQPASTQAQVNPEPARVEEPDTIDDPSIDADLDPEVGFDEDEKFYDDAEADLTIAYDLGSKALITSLVYRGGEVESDKYSVGHGVTIQGLSANVEDKLVPLDNYSIAPNFTVERKVSDELSLVIEGSANLTSGTSTATGAVGVIYEEGDVLAELKVFATRAKSDSSGFDQTTTGVDAEIALAGKEIKGFEVDLNADARIEADEFGNYRYDAGIDASVDLFDALDLAKLAHQERAAYADRAVLKLNDELDLSEASDKLEKLELPEGLKLASLLNLEKSIERAGYRTQSSLQVAAVTDETSQVFIDAQLDLAKALRSDLVLAAKADYAADYIAADLLPEGEDNYIQDLQVSAALFSQKDEKTSFGAEVLGIFDDEFNLTGADLAGFADYQLNDELTLSGEYRYQLSSLDEEESFKDHILGATVTYDTDEDRTAFASLEQLYTEEFSPTQLTARLGVISEFDSFLSKDRKASVNLAAQYQLMRGMADTPEMSGTATLTVPLN